MRSPTIKRFAFAILMSAAPIGAAFAACAPDQVTLKGEFGTIRFNVEIADDYDERARGLMHRQSMPTLSGMLFIYETPGPLSFWMRNTLIKLDMIFISPNGTISHIHENAQPLDETVISGGPSNLAVLEVNGGLVERFGISVGDVVQHEAFSDNDPVWPCD